MRPYKLGKRPATADARDLLARNYVDLAAILPTVPSRFGHGLDFPRDGWGMLGNDGAGDCYWAGGAHEEMLLAKILRSVLLPFTTDSVLSDYSAQTGYDPADPGSDQGTECRAGFAYRQDVGLVDGAGARHKIGPYVSIDPKNWDHLLVATFVFGVVGIGFEFPESAWYQFDEGARWDVVPGAEIDGGHYVPVVGSMSRDEEATCVTWGQRQTLSREFYEQYNDEAWAYVPGTLRSDGTGLHHVDVDTLAHDLAALRG